MDGNPKRYIVLDPHQRFNIKYPACARVSKRIPKGIGAYPKRSDIEARVASSKSKIFIFRIEGEQPHQHLLLLHCLVATRSLPNTTAGRPQRPAVVLDCDLLAKRRCKNRKYKCGCSPSNQRNKTFRFLLTL